MFRGENLSQFKTKNILVWTALAIQAGSINAGGFLACHRFVTHATGHATMFGLELAYGNILKAFSMLSVPLFYLSGAMLSACLVDQRMLNNKRPHYSIVMFTLAAIMILVTSAGNLGFFGPFGEDLSMTRDFILLALLAFASGLQNASVSMSADAIVRTTHLTGLITDLGIGLVRIITHSSNHSLKNEFRNLTMRTVIITSFILGTLTTFVYVKVQYWGFAIPSAIATALWLINLRPSQESLPQ